MGPPKNTVRTISQKAFDELVKENMDDLGMDPADALNDAIETLTLQGVDLSGIVTCVPGEGSVKDNPVLVCLDRLKQLDDSSKDQSMDKNLDEMEELLDKLTELCGAQGSGNAAIATRNGGVELLCSICSEIGIGCERALVSALKAMAALLHDLQSAETFRTSASTGNEILKESFMELRIDELILQILNGQSKGSLQSLYNAIRVLLTPDDNRVVASQVHGYARRFAKTSVPRCQSFTRRLLTLYQECQSEIQCGEEIAEMSWLTLPATEENLAEKITKHFGIEKLVKSFPFLNIRVLCNFLSKAVADNVNHGISAISSPHRISD
ncbi:hypothetical protein FNV43_RR22453 [Rhamnella rubrinervis]|uniref:Uncharacterized protein n=1 Tax=Rhamnella rubrinervis TaxID=2594499 RepID=A0A8K0DWM9_9ROSA|nr:hypothetical protein FNV43_RR22453 [Rhamnella rubrinervis]